MVCRGAGAWKQASLLLLCLALIVAVSKGEHAKTAGRRLQQDVNIPIDVPGQLDALKNIFGKSDVSTKDQDKSATGFLQQTLRSQGMVKQVCCWMRYAAVRLDF